LQPPPERLFVLKTLLAGGLSLSSAWLMSGCSSVTLGDPSSFTAISAPVSSLRVNETTQVATHTQFDGTKLSFYVNGVLGGNSELGTISSTGLYTAPAIVPIPNSISITSASRLTPITPREPPRSPSGTQFPSSTASHLPDSLKAIPRSP